MYPNFDWCLLCCKISANKRAMNSMTIFKDMPEGIVTTASCCSSNLLILLSSFESKPFHSWLLPSLLPSVRSGADSIVETEATFQSQGRHHCQTGNCVSLTLIVLLWLSYSGCLTLTPRCVLAVIIEWSRKGDVFPTERDRPGKTSSECIFAKCCGEWMYGICEVWIIY